jgi:hypothetical protein
VPLTIEISAEARARLEAEAARRGITLDQLVAEFAAELPTTHDEPKRGVLDVFFGSGDSGDST